MITIKNSHIRLFGYGILIISVIAFFLTWLRWYIGIPATMLLLLGYYRLSKNLMCDKSEINISKKTLFILCGIMLMWTILSGLGGAFPQKSDLITRNAILHDLINYSWPVRYTDGYDSSLTYYIAFWIIPALIGKITTLFMGIQAGWIAANIAYAFYCAAILCLVMLLLIGYLKATSLKRMLLVAVVLIFFSGMDILPIILYQLGEKTISIGTHLEWWTYIQYSSNTTQLSWVYNQAIPAWVVTTLLLHEKRVEHYAFLGLLLLPFGPIPFYGILFIMLLQGLSELLVAIRQKNLLKFLKQVFTIPNSIAVLVLFPIYYLYYSTNATTTQSGFNLNHFSLIQYLIFILVEFFIYVLLIMQTCYYKRFFIFSVLGLFCIPLFTLGSAQDFCMRASIPLLFIIMFYIIEYLLNNITCSSNGKILLSINTVVLLIFLTLGSATPLTEFRQSYFQTIQSDSSAKVANLENGNIGDNFITKHASDTLFYRYLARSNVKK